jgi:hypothetical protein
MLRNYAIGIRMKMRVQNRDSSPLFIIICSSTSPVTRIGATFKLAKLVNEILLTIKDPFITEKRFSMKDLYHKNTSVLAIRLLISSPPEIHKLRKSLRHSRQKSQELLTCTVKVYVLGFDMHLCCDVTECASRILCNRPPMFICT